MGRYYNEVGIKISSLRFSVRFPCAPAKPTKQNEDEYMELGQIDVLKSQWTWVPVQKRPLPSLPAPPIPPRSTSPLPPSSILPPYPSSTVSRSSKSSSKSRISSYV